VIFALKPLRWDTSKEQTPGTESWNGNRIMEQAQSSAEHTSKKKKEEKKGSWLMNDFNHIIYNDNVKLFLLLLGPDH